MPRISLTRIVVACLAVAACSSSDEPSGPGNGGETSTPTNLVAVSGDNQRVLVGTQLAEPFVVRVTDQNDDPVSGVAVTWSVTAGGGSLSQTSSTTATNGNASATLTAGSGDGANTVTASVDGLSGSPVTFTATAVSPSAIAITAGNNQTARVSRPLADNLEVRVTASDGGPVPGASVTWSVTAGSGSITPMSTVTDADGRTAASLTLGPAVGANTAQASAGAANTTFNATGTQPVSVTVNMQGIAFVAPGGGDDVTIMLGDTIRWVNLDGVQHTATSTSVPTGGNGFDSGSLGNGSEFTFVPNTRGTWVYYCQVHPAQMQDAQIAVQ